MNSETLHIKVSPALADGLRKLARSRSQPMGELVREAITNTYQLDFAGLSDHERLAVEAFRGGYISMAKLAEEMGMHALDMREWLRNHGLAPGVIMSDSDLDNA